MKVIALERVLLKYFSKSNKLNFNSDDCLVNWAGESIRQYDNGTRKLNKRHKKIGALYSIDLGYDRKKLD